MPSSSASFRYSMEKNQQWLLPSGLQAQEEIHTGSATQTLIKIPNTGINCESHKATWQSRLRGIREVPGYQSAQTEARTANTHSFKVTNIGQGVQMCHYTVPFRKSSCVTKASSKLWQDKVWDFPLESHTPPLPAAHVRTCIHPHTHTFVCCVFLYLEWDHCFFPCAPFYLFSSHSSPSSLLLLLPFFPLTW